jgi:pSer/pThr/pTyr-binding forkhead associated (FHA) protein
MVPPDSSNSLVFCQDTDSLNGTFLESCRLRSNETILLNNGDCIKIRHAASIFFLQAHVRKEDIESIIGDDFNHVRLRETFQIHNRLIGKGGQAKVV